MVAVAFGHWMAIAVFKDADGELVAKNALEFDYSLAWVAWALQVMPLFFLLVASPQLFRPTLTTAAVACHRTG